jgi:hypothetical protein
MYYRGYGHGCACNCELCLFIDNILLGNWETSWVEHSVGVGSRIRAFAFTGVGYHTSALEGKEKH